MNSRYFLRLALQNIDKHRQTYLPYMVALSSFVSMLYLLLFLRDNVVASHEINEEVFNYLLSGSAYVFAFFVVVFLIYSNNFLIRPRTKEFSLLNLFGLSQRHLIVIMLYEVVLIYVVSIVFGLLSGVVLSRLMSMVLASFIKTPLLMKQVVDVHNLGITTWVFVGVMCIVFLINSTQIVLAKPISLIQHNEHPKVSQWRQYGLLGLGLVMIGFAYWSIITIDSSQRAYAALAQVLLAIIIGTYFLFVSLSVTVLTILAKRPNVYYRSNNLIIINGLLNRIRINGVGLASVSVFSWVIMAMVSISAVIYFGANESVQKMYAADVIVTIQEHNIQSKERLFARISEVIADEGVESEYFMPYTFLSISSMQSGDTFTYEENNRTFVGDIASHYMVMITAREYNELYDESLQLAPDEVAVYSSYLPLPETFTLQGITYRVVARLPQLSITNYDLVQLVNAHYLVVHDDSVLSMHEKNKYILNNERPSPIRYRIGINLNGTAAQELAVFRSLQKMLAEDDVITRIQRYPNQFIEIVNMQSRQSEKMVFEAVYGTFLFLGLFLGMLFTVSTALLIYYKQLLEGYEDKQRYEILQRIGMTRDEVRTSVDQQVILMFFIPLVVAAVHFVISLHQIRYLLELFRIQSATLVITAGIGTLLMFSLIYLVIYRVSARVYYHIVR